MDTIYFLGLIPVHVWGLFAAAALIVGTWLAARRAPSFGIVARDVADFAPWCLFAAFIGARLVHVFVYEPMYYLAHPGDILRVWEGGLSSFGGMFGAVLAAWVFVRHRRIPFISLADTVLGALPIAYAIGRIGCAVTHMHPGIPCASAFICRVFPDNVQRLDLGLLEAILWAVIAVVVLATERRLVRSGATTALVLACYGVGRFILDTFRVVDVRYFGFTPAQYGALALLIIAALLVVRMKETPRAYRT